MNKKYVFICALLLAILLSVFLNFFMAHDVPGCLNADEAAFGYNAYSILKTGRDEFGRFLPLRLQSFNDFKLPLYSYLSILPISIFGLNEFSVRLFNKILGILLVPLMYLVAKEIFKNKYVALIASYLTATSVWILLLSRHAHEAVVAGFLILLGIYILCIYHRKHQAKYFYWANGLFFLSTFAYHSSRILFIALILYQIAQQYHKVKAKFLQSSTKLLFPIILLVCVFAVDLLYGTQRLNSLLFLKNTGFHGQITEYINEDSNRIIHNKLTASVIEVTYRYFSQFSTEFFLRIGDANPRFGMKDIGILTPIELILCAIGIFALFKTQHKLRWLLVMLLLVPPIGNALTWQEHSLTRVFFQIIPIVLISAYGMLYLYEQFKGRIRMMVVVLVIGAFVFFRYSSLDTYFFHYFKRGLTIRAWQCGYNDLVDELKKSPADKKVFVTKSNGQPYIYVLFYTQYDPEKYMKEKRLSKPDEYGFTQVESFGKYVFNIPEKMEQRSGVYAGFKEDFEGKGVSPNDIKIIKYAQEEMFWVYPSTTKSK